MDALKWEQCKIFRADKVAYNPDNAMLNYYVGEDYTTGKFGAISPDDKRIGNYDTEAEAMEACEAHFATNGGW